MQRCEIYRIFFNWFGFRIPRLLYEQEVADFIVGWPQIGEIWISLGWVATMLCFAGGSRAELEEDSRVPDGGGICYGGVHVCCCPAVSDILPGDGVWRHGSEAWGENWDFAVWLILDIFLHYLLWFGLLFWMRLGVPQIVIWVVWMRLGVPQIIIWVVFSFYYFVLTMYIPLSVANSTMYFCFSFFHWTKFSSIQHSRSNCHLLEWMTIVINRDLKFIQMCAQLMLVFFFFSGKKL